MNTQEDLKQRADQLIADAEAAGMDITINLVSGKPLAMGNHKMVAEVVAHHPY